MLNRHVLLIYLVNLKLFHGFSLNFVLGSFVLDQLVSTLLVIQSLFILKGCTCIIILLLLY